MSSRISGGPSSPDAVPPEQTRRECDFIESFLPLAEHPDLLDLACETGRHSIELARRGYRVVGADINAKVLQVARETARAQGVGARFIELDVLELHRLTDRFDGVILFWQSFGFFDRPEQVGIFREIHRILRPGGQLILDLYNRLYFTRSGDGNDPSIPPPHRRYDHWDETERITSMLSYEEDQEIEDRRLAFFSDPNLPTAAEIAGITANYGLKMIAACSDYSPEIASTPGRPRMQLVFERKAGEGKRQK